MRLAELKIPNYDTILQEKTEDAKNTVKTQSRNFYGKLEKALEPLGYTCGPLTFNGDTVTEETIIPSFHILKKGENMAKISIEKGRLDILPLNFKNKEIASWAEDYKALTPGTTVDFIKKYFGE
jgi:hypothetical protein